MRVDAAATGVTEDAILGGRLRLLQPTRGHRVGHDAVLLAASVTALPGDHAVEFGAGVGAAGLALASRVAGLRLTLAEVDPSLVALARANIDRNGLGHTARALALDVTAPARSFAAKGLPSGCAQRVLMNPPFNDPARHRASPDPERRRAHNATSSGLQTWVAAAARLLSPKGELSLIWRADGLAELLAALAPRFGGIAVRPVHPRANAPAIRVLVKAVKDSRSPLTIWPALVLQDAQDKPTPEAESLLRHGLDLPFAG